MGQKGIHGLARVVVLSRILLQYKIMKSRSSLTVTENMIEHSFIAMAPYLSSFYVLSIDTSIMKI